MLGRPSDAPYTSLNKKSTLLVDHRDIKILDSIDNHSTQFFTRIASACPDSIKRIAKAAATLVEEIIINPIAGGISAFFTKRNRQKNELKPISDAVMVPGNIVISLAHLLPINRKGQLGIPAVFAVVGDLALLVRDAWNSDLDLIYRIKNPIAALFAILLGMYSALLMLSIANGMIVDLLSFTEALEFNPINIIENLIASNPSGWQKLTLFAAGFTGALNGIVMGKDLVLYQAEASVYRFWINVRTRFFEAHLEEVEQLKHRLIPTTTASSFQSQNPNDGVYAEAKALDMQYQHISKLKKDWDFIHLISCTLIVITSFPAAFLALPNHAVQKLPLIKGALENNHLLPKLRHRQYLGMEKKESTYPSAGKTSLFFGMLASSLDWVDQLVPESEFKDVDSIVIPPDYDEMLHLILTHDYAKTRAFFPLFIEALIGFFTRSAETPQQMKLARELKHSFLTSFANYLEGLPQNEPLMPGDSHDRPPAYFNPRLFREIGKRADFKKLMKGDFSETLRPPILSFTEKAKKFNETVYSNMCYMSPYTSSEQPSLQGSVAPTPKRSAKFFGGRRASTQSEKDQKQHDEKHRITPPDQRQQGDDWLKFHKGQKESDQQSEEGSNEGQKQKRRHSDTEVVIHASSRQFDPY